MNKKQIDREIQSYKSISRLDKNVFNYFKRNLLSLLQSESLKSYAMEELKKIENDFEKTKVEKVPQKYFSKAIDNASKNKVDKTVQTSRYKEISEKTKNRLNSVSNKEVKASTKEEWHKSLRGQRDENYSKGGVYRSKEVSKKPRKSLPVSYIESKEIRTEKNELRILKASYLGQPLTNDLDESIAAKLGIRKLVYQTHYSSLSEAEKFYRLFTWEDLFKVIDRIPKVPNSSLPKKIASLKQMPTISEWNAFGKGIVDLITDHKLHGTIRKKNSITGSKYGLAVPKKGDYFKIIYTGKTS